MARKMKSTDQVAVNGASRKQRDEAWKALQKFNELRPTLTGFARNITGNRKIEVHATSSSPYSTGNKIFIRPPLGLGRDYGHNRRDCGQRGSDGRQICEACRVREVVDFYLYHEVGHVWLGSQVMPNDDDYNLVTDFVNEWHPKGACHHAPGLIRDMQCEILIMPVVATLSPYVAFIWNALEDARVNEGMFEARPGLRKIFDVNIDRMMNEGSEQINGDHVTWHECPLDSQFMVGLSMMACGYGYGLDAWLHPKVAESLTDERIVELTEKARHAESAHVITELSLQAFAIAQELGYCVVPKCQPVPEELEQPNPQKDSEDGQQDGSSISGIPGDPSPDGLGGDDSSTERVGGEGSTGTGAGNGDQARESSQTSDPQKSSGIPDEDSSGEADESGDRSSDSGASEDNSSFNDEEADEAEVSGGGGNDREEEPGAGDDAEGSETGGIDSSGGSTDDGSDDEPVENGQSVLGSSSSLAGSNPSDGDGVSSSGVSSGEGDDTNQDGDGDNSTGSRGGSEDDPREDGTAGGELDDNKEDDNDLNIDDEPENPWDVNAPEETGAGYGPVPEAGTIEDVEKALAPFLMHGFEDKDGMLEDMLGEDLKSELLDLEEGANEFFNASPLIKAAIAQVLYFDDPSIYVAGVDVATFPNREIGWEAEQWSSLTPSESIIGAAVLHARRVFEENRRSHLERNQKSGKINTRVLAKRAPVGDPRLFGKKTIPKKRSYLVIITGDCSASTSSFRRNEKIRRLMMAQGDILHRTGVPFIMMGHSASNAKIKNFRSSRADDYWMYVLPIKNESEGWGPQTKSRLAGMRPVSENLDGHTLEYCRKLADKSQATDVIIIYYTDGEMPAANYSEERDILEREVKLCQRKGYHLLGVGINTDSPKHYGMNTVKVDSDEDIILVIKQLEEVLTK